VSLNQRRYVGPYMLNKFCSMCLSWCNFTISLSVNSPSLLWIGLVELGHGSSMVSVTVWIELSTSPEYLSHFHISRSAGQGQGDRKNNGIIYKRNQIHTFASCQPLIESQSCLILVVQLCDGKTSSTTRPFVI